ncbi:hypothetical protein BJ978_000317 [Agromyces terreus]|uniref:Uncharacterized protein n=1 Tax=Agromyces terreus TaxID=424795 RepID=A0A9X2KAU6_9MICO|nr:hypothetical protein [Agromyces terreus]MCP2369641.1 hypothetical protein [Agromyces terreus]
MPTHLEYVAGPLGDWSALPCACGRTADHRRPGSSTYAAMGAGVAGASAATPDSAAGARRRRMSRAVVRRLSVGAVRLDALRSRTAA